MRMGWDGMSLGPGRALSAVSCLMDISREEELAFEIRDGSGTGYTVALKCGNYRGDTVLCAFAGVKELN